MSEDVAKEKDRPVRLLSFDGGGVSGLSSLIILEEFMKRLQGHQKLSEIPRPCEWFDVVAGTGTGGIIAILLGRLGLRVGEAIEAYQEILREAYSEKKLFGDDTTFKATNLENAISRVVVRYTSNASESMADPKTDTGGCKTFVCAMLASNMRASEPVLIRSYKFLENDGPNCSIVQAARATSAMTGLFKPVTIDELGIKVAYVDGGLGNNNPTAHTLAEAGRLFPTGNVSFVLSIGAGHLQPIGLSSSKDAKKLGLCIATDSERIAQEMARRFQYTTDLYFRFNVDQGLQHIGATSWEKLTEVAVHSRQHTQMFEVNTRMAQAVKAFSAGAVFVPTTQLNGIIPPTELVKALRSCPPPSAAFTGREDVLTQIHDCIFDGSEARHVFVLHGLGGAGKTQSALKFVHMHRERFLDVFYLDATSTHTIEADLKSIAAAKKTGKSSGDALQWLASQRKWLIVYNNADNTSLNLQSYIPPCAHGDILITTRNRQLISLAQGTNAHRQVSTMQPEDGKRLLLKISRVPEDGQTDKLSEAIVNELGGLALAIVQAGAYICVHECGLAAYLDMYQAYRGELLKEYRNLSQKLDDYQWTVYTTWRVSLGKLSSKAVELFYLLSFMHHERISEETFRRAYLRIAARESSASPSEPFSPEDPVITFLSGFGAPDLTWYRPAFLSLMTEIRSYSLIDFDPLSNTYSIHPLVQSWARTTASQPHEAEKRTVSVFALSVDKEFGSQDYEYRAKLIPHLDSLAQTYDTEPRLARKFAMVYQEAGRYQAAKVLQSAAVDFNKRTLGDDHPDTLTDMFDLAAFCSDNGDLQEAEKLYAVVVEGRTRVLGDSHPDTYRTLAYLALNYQAQGRFHEAEPIQVQVLEAAKHLLGQENRETLQCQHALAATYQGMGQIRKAESLLVELVEVEKKALGINHPVTLTSTHNLASIFEKLGKFDDAEALAVQTLEIWRHLSGPTHPDVLSCMAILGGIRHTQGRPREALEIQIELDGLYKQTLGEAHPATLANSGNLACTYQALGRTSEAEDLYRQVLDTKIRVLGREHADVLSTLNNLASLYAIMPGREAEAETMMVNEIDDRSRRPSNNDIGGTAGLMINLASLYTRKKRWKDAETLIKEALAMQVSVFGPEHYGSVASRKMLSNIQHDIRHESALGALGMKLPITTPLPSPMSTLPLEILEYICECTTEPVVALEHGEQGVCSAGQLGLRDVHYSALIGFSGASQKFREISAPYLFRRLKVRTVEQAAQIVASPLLGYARHIHLPAVDALTCRRPVAASVRRLVSRVPSLRISAADSSFFFNARAPLSGLLRSTGALETLEVYCGPILEGFDTLSLIADLIPACPGSLKALHLAMPGGQPDYSGVEALLDAIGSTLPPGTDGRLSGLETISLSVHLIPHFASRPERLALALARRLPALRTVTFVAPGRNTRKEISVLDLIGSSTEREGGSRYNTWTWQVQRDLDMVCAGAKYELGGNVSLEGVIGLELDVLA